MVWTLHSQGDVMVTKSKVDAAPVLGKKKKTMYHTIAKPEVSDLIAERLRSFYDDVAKQPIPDRFLELLNQLQTTGTRQKKT